MVPGGARGLSNRDHLHKFGRGYVDFEDPHGSEHFRAVRRNRDPSGYRLRGGTRLKSHRMRDLADYSRDRAC
jgi:hypothetical protein